jgi:hypothetical protein
MLISGEKIKKFSRIRFEDEFFLDEAMKRRIQRWKQAEQNRQDMDDEDEDDVDESLLVGSQRQAQERGETRVVMKLRLLMRTL